MQGYEGMSAAEYSGAIYGALSKRQAAAEARRRGWSGDDARTGKSALCDWLAERVPAGERAALVNSGAAQVVVVDAPAVAEMPQQLHGRPALFPGRCPVCDGLYAKGEPIIKMLSGKWGHATCAAKENAPARQEQPTTQSVQPEQPKAAPEGDNAADVAQAIAAALAGLRIKAGMDADAVRALVREEITAMPAALPREIAVTVNDAPAVKVQGHVHPAFEKVLRLVAAGVNVLLVGPAGCGKSHMAHQIADALKRDYGTLHCSAGVSESQVTGWLLPTGAGGAFEFRPSHFATLYSAGNSVFLIDEIDAADPNMLTVLNGALANGALHIPQCVDKPEWKRGKDAAIVAAANTYGNGADAMYVGRNQLDAATLDRFYVVEMDYDATLEAAIAGRPAPAVKAWQAGDANEGDVAIYSEWCAAVRGKVQSAKLRRVVSTRTLQKGIAALRAGVRLAEVKRDVLAGWTRDERSKVGE